MMIDRETCMTKIPRREEKIERARQLATPVDVAKLEKEEIIEQRGAWYKVNRIKDLPEHAQRQIRAMKTNSQGQCFVQFPKSWKHAQQVYRRLTGKEFDG
jgi:hypothetical protein